MSTEPTRKPYPDRLATAVRRRRKRLDLSTKQVADAAGISIRALNFIEAPVPGHPVRHAALDGLDQALQWQQGSARRVYVYGGNPTPQPHEDLPRQLAHELPEVQLIVSAGLPRPVELAILEHLAARRQDMEAALEDEAAMLVKTLGSMLTLQPPEDLP